MRALPCPGRQTFLALLALCSGAAEAFVDAPTFEPAWPTAADEVVMHVRAGACHGFTDGPGEVEVAVAGNVMDVIIDGISEEDPLWCNLPAFDYTFRIGRFDPGNYVVRIAIRNAVPPFQVFPPIASAPLGVAPPPAPVPSSGMLSIIGGALLLLALARRKLGPAGRPVTTPRTVLRSRRDRSCT